MNRFPKQKDLFMPNKPVGLWGSSKPETPDAPATDSSMRAVALAFASLLYVGVCVSALHPYAAPHLAMNQRVKAPVKLSPCF